MSTILKKALSFIPIMTILSWIFPGLVKAYETWKASPTPQNIVHLGETAANTLAQEFDPSLLPELIADEHIADTAITSIISAADEPSVTTVELALLENAKASVAILKRHGVITTDVTEESIQNALVPMYQLLADAGLK